MATKNHVFLNLHHVFLSEPSRLHHVFLTTQGPSLICLNKPPNNASGLCKKNHLFYMMYFYEPSEESSVLHDIFLCEAPGPTDCLFQTTFVSFGLVFMTSWCSSIVMLLVSLWRRNPPSSHFLCTCVVTTWHAGQESSVTLLILIHRQTYTFWTSCIVSLGGSPPPKNIRFLFLLFLLHRSVSLMHSLYFLTAIF